MSVLYKQRLMSVTKLVKDNNNDLAMFPYNLRQSGINPFICIYQKMTQIRYRIWEANFLNISHVRFDIPFLQNLTMIQTMAKFLYKILFIFAW